jgi:hypothetical protein
MPKSVTHVLSALNSQQLDTSDFILLSTRLIELATNASPSNESLLKVIRQHYLQQNYEGAIENIFKICALEENKSTLGQEIIQKLTLIKSRLHDEPTKNKSRRFYETLYALKLEDQNKSATNYSMFQQFSNILNSLRGSPLQLVSNFNDALKVITAICALNDRIEMELKKQSPKYNVKDRDRNENERCSSSNPGIMKPLSPNFADHLIPPRAVDKVNLDLSVDQGYSKSNPTVPFVTSISGTTFTLVALLEKYIQKYQGDKDLTTQVNRIVNLFISTYIIKGYHSYLEMIDVLKEPAIHSIFARNNIQLDYGIIDAADEFRKAQDYALGLSLKSNLHASIKKIEPHKPSHIKTVIHHPVIKKHQSEDQAKTLQEQSKGEQAKALHEQPKGEQAKLQKEARINEILAPIDTALADLARRVEEVNQEQFSHAYGIASNLVVELKAARDRYKDNMECRDLFSDELFKSTCRATIITAKPILQDALGWGDYLTNLLKTLANAVIKMVTLGHRNNFFTLVKSDLENAVIIAERDLQLNNAPCHA